MNRRLLLASIVIATVLAPGLVSAAPYFDFNWHDEPSIVPTGSPDIVFPVSGGATFSDDFNDARGSGVHEGNDLMAPKMTPIIAARGGRVSSAPTTQPSYGYIISIAGDDGYKYSYLHINNDTPGTDDGLGTAASAYAPGIQQGAQVSQGQVIAYVGDSGNAESTGSHLHFEIRLPDNTPINPYPYLNISLKINAFDVNAVKATSPTINTDKSLATSTDTRFCESGSLIRTALISSVYYCGADGKRYVFPNAQTYNSWYKDFGAVKVISAEDLSKILLGGNVTYRPGVKLLKTQIDSRVYAVDHNGLLRLLTTPAVATKYYGANWAKNVDDIPESFFINYKIGLPIYN